MVVLVTWDRGDEGVLSSLNSALICTENDTFASRNLLYSIFPGYFHRQCCNPEPIRGMTEHQAVYRMQPEPLATSKTRWQIGFILPL